MNKDKMPIEMSNMLKLFKQNLQKEGYTEEEIETIIRNEIPGIMDKMKSGFESLLKSSDPLGRLKKGRKVYEELMRKNNIKP
ncbi:MAG: hypothetical protein OXE77_12055 [Flavobacteriaceae bacterium]|nr:hypothetical protein [Flavobacteriaceae bacterium]MCY4267633.1 hypothetical protein [Flavobacteriaceae bacterium]